MSNWKQKDLEGALVKLFNYIKPEEVSSVKFKITPHQAWSDRWTMVLTYYVPIDSSIMDSDTFSLRELRREWSLQAHRLIKNLLGEHIAIDSLSIEVLSTDKKKSDEDLQTEALKKLERLIL
jgi:hypothetical protein